MPKVYNLYSNNLADNKGRAVTTLNASLELIKTVFEKIKTNESITEFRDGLSSYLAASYYKYRTKKNLNQEDLENLEKKLKLAMDLLAGALE
jgi:ribonucleotide reductase alpha subunit